MDTEDLVLPDAAAWRAWLDEHEDDPDGVWLVLAKKGTTEPTSLTYDQALDEALCSGWIDGQKRGRDAATFRQRFTPRRRASLWSQRNIGIVATLVADGRMRERGQAEIDRAKGDGRWDRAYAGAATATVPDDLRAALDAAPAAAALFAELDGTNRYAVLHRVTTAPSAAARANRIAKLVGGLERGETPYPRKPPAERGVDVRHPHPAASRGGRALRDASRVRRTTACMTTGTDTTRPAASSGTFRIGGDLEVHRLGYGTMQLTGPGVWGPPKDRDEAVRVLKRAVELGVDFFDTADSYGPYVAEDLLREALHPYGDDIVIATKAGLTRTGPNEWPPVGRPEYLRQEAEMSLRRLGLERIDLFQLHRIDPKVPLEDQIGELKKLQDEGKIRHIGLSEVSVDDVKAAQEHATIVSVQNLYNLQKRDAEDLLDWSEEQGIGFIPWFPLATGGLTGDDSPLTAIAERKGATPAQLALAWLLKRSPVMLPIPGTSSVDHLEDNLQGAVVELTDEEFEELSGLGH